MYVVRILVKPRLDPDTTRRRLKDVNAPCPVNGSEKGWGEEREV